MIGDKDNYYAEMAKMFYKNPNNEDIWNKENDLKLNISWLNPIDRKVKNNVWEQIKILLKKISDDTLIISSNKNEYQKVTLGHLLLFIILLRIRKHTVVFL